MNVVTPPVIIPSPCPPPPAAQGASPVSLLSQLGPTALQTVAGLGALLLADRLIMKRIFEVRGSSGSRDWGSEGRGRREQQGEGQQQGQGRRWGLNVGYWDVCAFWEKDITSHGQNDMNAGEEYWG